MSKELKKSYNFIVDNEGLMVSAFSDSFWLKDLLKQELLSYSRLFMGRMTAEMIEKTMVAVLAKGLYGYRPRTDVSTNFLPYMLANEWLDGEDKQSLFASIRSHAEDIGPKYLAKSFYLKTDLVRSYLKETFLL